MRKITQKEADGWRALAQQYGFLNEEGRFALGRFVTEQTEEGVLLITFITPLPAGIYTEKSLQKKTPPIMFDRTPLGEIIIPGRWWASMFEGLAFDQNATPEDRESAILASRHIEISDAFLPVETDTIEIDAPDADGNRVTTEALAPGSTCIIHLKSSDN